jgi:hypothetical protein
MTSDPPTTWSAPPAALPLHPQARTAMVLGIISVAGVIFVAPILLGPLAWYFGAVARREIERDPTRWRGRSQGTVGMILGIVGTALLIVALFVGTLAITGLLLLLHPQSGYGS